MPYKIVSKYIKDISFEIPNAESFTMLEKEISKYKLNFDIKSNPLKNDVIEVNTVLKMLPNIDVKHKIHCEINFTTIISLENVSKKEELEKIVLIEIPQYIYPFIYETFVFLFKQSGIKEVSIEKKIDFQKMHNEQKKIN
jgi:preprotein translocase subunit SecB